MRQIIRTVIWVGILIWLSTHSWSCNPNSLDWEELSVTDLQGQTVDLSEYKGKPILLNFWATWCGPCVGELPSMAQAKAALGEDVVFLLISDEALPTLTAFQEKRVLPFHMFHLTSSLKLAGIFSIPQTYLVDREGKITDAYTGSHDWNSPKMLQHLREIP